jgi:hypothetical protein
MREKRFTVEELEFLRENYQRLTNKELSEHLDRSIDSITSKLYELDLKRKSNPNPYTEDEKTFIRDNMGKMTISDIAKSLGRTQGGISKFVSKYRVNDTRKRKQAYLGNIEKDVVPFFSKGDNYYEIIANMEVGDSFEFPESDKAVVSNQKYIVINEEKKLKSTERQYMMRRSSVVDEVQMYRMWRLS